MLVFNKKIELFKSYLEQKNNDYRDIMKNEIYFYFFENQGDLSFLNDINTIEAIENKIEQVVSRMILHEDDDDLINIIAYQFFG